MKSKHLFLVLFIMLVYGSSYPVGKLGVDNIPPLLFSVLRVGLIFLVFLPLDWLSFIAKMQVISKKYDD